MEVPASPALVLWKLVAGEESVKRNAFRRTALSADVDHGSGGGDEVGFADVVPFFLFLDDCSDEVGYFFVAGAAAHLGVQIVIPDGEEAGANLAIAGNADAAAMAAKGVRNRRDDSDLSHAVIETVAARGFGVRAGDFDQRTILGHTREDFVERDDR